LSVVPEDDERPNQKDEAEIPRQSIFAAMPKRTFYRVVLLLAALAGIIYLRERTSSIAGCMSTAFNLPPPGQPRVVPESIKARVVLPAHSSDKFH
jgi:hypothetical protein